MIYNAVIELLGTPPVGFEWVPYLASLIVLIALLSICSSLIVKILRIPFRGL